MRTGDLVLLTLLLAGLLAWPLVSPPVGAHGEAREALVVQDVVTNGHWTLPTRLGELPSKPPLFHWIAAAGAHLFGLSDVTVRLPSALAAGVVLLSTYALGVAAGGRIAGWLAAGALLGMQGFFASATEARVDMVLVACTCGTLVAFLRWYQRPTRLAQLLCYLSAAAAVLAKGPVGALLPALVILVFLVWERRLDALRTLWSWPLAGLVLAVDLGWYGLATAAGGREFVALQLMRENVDRFVGRGDFGLHGGRSRLTLVGALATDLLPWNLALPWAAVQRWRGARTDTVSRFLHAWWLVVVGFFTVAFGKRHVYLLPLYPAVAALAGNALARAVAAAPPDRLLGVVPVPARVSRAFPRQPALALLAIVLAIFDVGMVGISQVVREHAARKKSLVAFAREVDRLVPAHAALAVTPELAGSDRQLLAYRLGRPLHATEWSPAHGCEPRYYLAPADDVARLLGDGAAPLAVSRRRSSNVALLVGPRDAACPPLTAPGAG